MVRVPLGPRPVTGPPTVTLLLQAPPISGGHASQPGAAPADCVPPCRCAQPALNLRLLAGCTSPWALGGLPAWSGRAVALGLLCPRSPASWSPHRSAACWEQRMKGSARAWFPQVTRSRATPGSHSVWRVWTTCVYGSDGHLASPEMSAVMTPVYPSAQPRLSRNRFREYLSDSVN